MSTYNIRVSKPRPSMMSDKYIIEVDSYQEAVELAQQKWRETGRRVSLASGTHGLTVWHRVSYDGRAVDKNTNSGVPEFEQLTR